MAEWYHQFVGVRGHNPAGIHEHIGAYGLELLQQGMVDFPGLLNS